MAQALNPHQWKERVIILFAESPNDEAFDKQLTSLQADKEGVDDRELVIYQIFTNHGIRPDGEQLDEVEVAKWRKRFKINVQEFTFILIGKDGGQKLIKAEFVPLSSLYGLIDSMPMRQAEMRRKND